MSTLLKSQRIRPAQTSLGKPTSVDYSGEVYIDPEIVADLQLNQGKGTVAVYHYKSSSQFSQFTSWVYSDVRTAFLHSPIQGGASESIRALSRRLCEVHPDISVDPSIFAGNPHIKGIRLTVANILAKLYIYGSIEAVAKIYQSNVTEDQIKEAIAYAQDFLEEAVHSHEAS